MNAREIPSDSSLETLWSELVYTEARLLADPHARLLARSVMALVTRVEHVQQGQRDAWRGEIIAQATVDAAHDGLDDVLTDFEREVRHAVKDDRGNATYQRYFATPNNEILRLGLASEVTKVRAWPETIRTEPVHAVRPFGDTLETAVNHAETAITLRETAVGATATHRARQIIALVDDANGARRSLHAALEKRAIDAGLAKSWPDRFFRHGAHHAAHHAPAPATPSTPSTTP